MSSEVNQLYRFAEFEIDPANRRLSGAGEPVAVHSRAFDLLLYMVRNPNRLLSKDELMRAVWSDAAVEESNLSQSVFVLRKALAAAAPESNFIVTAHGRGYRFEASVEERVESPAGPKAVPDLPVSLNGHGSQTTAPSAQVQTSQPIYWITAVAILAVATFAGWRTSWFGLYPQPVPGDHHEVVLADFENTTGEAGFEQVLKVVLSSDLRQSPFFQVASGDRTRRTMQLMQRQPTDRLTPALAREVCQRMDDEAVLAGMIARFDRKYLVTLSASDCMNGQDLATTKATANDLDSVPAAVDSVAAEMRARLGEPLKSRRHFDKPLLNKATGSFEALKSYSAGHSLAADGRFSEAVPLLQKAVALDPRFPAAWDDLGTIAFNLGQPESARAALEKAFALRDLANERDRLHITGTYHSVVTGNLSESIRNWELWTETYARDVPPWANLAEYQRQMGRYDLAIEPAKHAVSLDPDDRINYIILARSQLGAGLLDDAISTCQQALLHKLDSDDVRAVMMRGLPAR